ncbi:hypothetical protein C818_03490 [Lachnospiraceae bacterium MD308]|nr:hypothetical protein C818_03490 [Lachnospiraceae bacterium MD308]
MKLMSDNSQVISETATVYGWSEYIGIHALASVINSLTGSSGLGIGVGINISYPPHSDKSRIYKMEKIVRKEGGRRGIGILETRIFENPLIAVPSVTVSGIAVVSEKREECLEDGLGIQGISDKKSLAGADIVLSKWIGMDGMLQIAREKMEALAERFTPGFIRQVLSYETELYADKEIGIAKDLGAIALYQITQGGIFASLWEMSKELKTGLEMDMKQFSILQETVEVCELFRLNPYQLTSAGCFLFVTEDGEKLREGLLKEGVMASIIGKTVEGKGKIIRNGEDVRCVDRPAPDEIWKLHVLEG